MKKILILDNYDSFTYNISHLVESLGYTCDIYRNDKISLEAVGAYDKIILSPGPGIPCESGILCDLIRTYGSSKSIFGICLGEQAIGEVYGAVLSNLTTVFHGVESDIVVTSIDPIFEGLDKEFKAGRYHSWIVSGEGFPSDVLEVTAIEKESGEIMALRHKTFDVCGVQFHPESVLSPEGGQIIKNWLEL